MRHEIAILLVVAIGDMPIDLPMLAWAGRSAAVANAHSDVIAAVSKVVASNDEDGVADLLELLGHGPGRLLDLACGGA